MTFLIYGHSLRATFPEHFWLRSRQHGQTTSGGGRRFLSSVPSKNARHLIVYMNLNTSSQTDKAPLRESHGSVFHGRPSFLSTSTEISFHF